MITFLLSQYKNRPPPIGKRAVLRFPFNDAARYAYSSSSSRRLRSANAARPTSPVTISMPIGASSPVRGPAAGVPGTGFVVVVVVVVSVVVVVVSVSVLSLSSCGFVVSVVVVVVSVVVVVDSVVEVVSVVVSVVVVVVFVLVR